MSELEFITIESATDATASVIWLHGLGADGHDFEPIVPELGLPADHGIRFIFPHAPVQPVTINGGIPMRAWYDIYALSTPIKEDEQGIRRAQQLVAELVEQEHAKGIAYERIVLAGFSQGGAMALFTGLRWPERLAGILALSCYLPMAMSLPNEASQQNKATPIFMGHGMMDTVLPMALGQMSQGFLAAQGYQVEWHTYPMEHSVNMDEIRDIGLWLKRVLS